MDGMGPLNPHHLDRITELVITQEYCNNYADPAAIISLPIHPGLLTLWEGGAECGEHGGVPFHIWMARINMYKA